MAGDFASKLYQFYKDLTPPDKLPRGVQILFPQAHDEVMKLVSLFLKKYYSDNRPRRLMLGINPGRFGAGVTGINFTAPRQLKNNLGIEHSMGNSSELSAEFIYEMIDAYGGPNAFYGDYFLSSVSPLGFTSNGINLNYYDDKELMKMIRPFIVENIQKQISFGFKTDHCICIGGEKNYKYLAKLNKEFGFFERITSVPHPRFIMQYRRKEKEAYIKEYLNALRN
jgi:hypothetical protein